MPLADITFGELLLVVVEIFLFVIWIWILFTIVTDLFRDHEMSGWAKAIWLLFLIFIPFLTGLVYLIVRGGGMRDRAIKAQTDAKAHFDEYVRTQAHTSPADELHKLNDLKEKGALSAEEFDRAKAKLLACGTLATAPLLGADRPALVVAPATADLEVALGEALADEAGAPTSASEARCRAGCWLRPGAAAARRKPGAAPARGPPPCSRGRHARRPRRSRGRRSGAGRG